MTTAILGEPQALQALSGSHSLHDRTSGQARGTTGTPPQNGAARRLPHEAKGGAIVSTGHGRANGKASTYIEVKD